MLKEIFLADAEVEWNEQWIKACLSEIEMCRNLFFQSYSPGFIILMKLYLISNRKDANMLERFGEPNL